MDTRVQADVVYTNSGDIRFHLGPVFVVLQGREAALSMRELIDKLAPVIDELYPDLDTEMQRQHRATLRQAALDSTGSRAAPLSRRGGPPRVPARAPLIGAVRGRRIADTLQGRAPGLIGHPIGRPCATAPT
jgi:hypothetical protein